MSGSRHDGPPPGARRGARFGAWLGTWTDTHRRALVLAWTVFFVVCAVLTTRLRIDPDLATLLPDERIEVRALTRASDLDQGSRDLLIVVRERAVADEPARLAALAAALAADETVESVATARDVFAEEGEEARRAPLWYLPEPELERLEHRLSGAGRLQAARESRALLEEDPLLGREVVRRDPLGLRAVLRPEALHPLAQRFVAERDDLVLARSGAALLRLRGRAGPFDQDATARLIEHVQATLRDVSHELVGGYAVAAEDAARIRGDMVRSSLTSLPLLLLFLILATGRFALAHLVLMPVVVAVAATLGIGGVLLGPLPVLVVASVAILAGLGVDYGLHVVTRLALESEAGGSARGALVRALAAVTPALLAGAATSMAAFLAFAATSIAGLARFGLLLAGGLGVSLAAAMTLVPALASRARRPRRNRGVLVRWVRALERSRARVPVAVLMLGTCAALAASAVVRGLRFDADPGFLRPPDAAAGRAAERLADELGFAANALLVLTPGGASPAAVHAAGARLASDERVGLVTGAASGTLDDERALRVDAFRRRTAGWVEGALGDLAAQGLRPEALAPALEEQAALFAADPLSERTRRDGAAAHPERIEWEGRSWLRSAVHPALIPAGPRERDALREAVRAAFPAGSLVVDPWGLADLLGPSLRHALERSLGWCAAAVGLIAWLFLGRWRDTLVALLPCLCALGAALGLLALAGWPVHPGNLVALPMVVGLGVDDGLHLVLSHRERAGPTGGLGRRAAPGGEDALAATLSAIWRTTATTVIGFGSLVFSVTPALASLGWVVAIGTSSAFLATVTLVPAMMGGRDAR